MNTLSIGKLRGLQQCSAPNGTFACLALDHRQNLRRALNLPDSSAVGDAELTGFKLELTVALADLATAVLLDPEYGAAQAIAAGILPKKTGLVVALESTGYTGDPAARISQLLPGWSIEKARRMGADMVKLLVYFHPEAPTAGDIEAFVGQVAQDCLRQDLGLMLEPLSYSLQAERKLGSSEKRQVVVETARRLTLPGVDILKAEFPLDPVDVPNESEWAKACTEISSASRAPWILLSAAVDYQTYLRQVEIACRAGASGIAVGRAVWQEAVELRGAARMSFLKDIARPRLERLAVLCAELGKPWTDFYVPPEMQSEWYKSY
ncbi:MAG: tagatose 1,6-diphosphate aldolase [Anaerolineales bacterium]